MKIRSLYIYLLFCFYTFSSFANDTIAYTHKQRKISIINPGLELEYPLYRRTSLVLNPGIGYNISFPNTTEFTPSGWLYMISPYLDLQYRFYYNIDKRARLGLYSNNSANFFSIRCLYRGKSIKSNFTRTTNNDYSFSLNWGVQRTKNKTYYNFNIGPMYYLDFKGSDGAFINLEFNFGFLL